jgi:hypothetical protein
MKDDGKLELVAALTYLVLVVAMAVGWIMNAITIWNTIDNPITAKFILRVVGIFVAPIGGILGYLA